MSLLFSLRSCEYQATKEKNHTKPRDRVPSAVLTVCFVLSMSPQMFIPEVMPAGSPGWL